MKAILKTTKLTMHAATALPTDTIICFAVINLYATANISPGTILAAQCGRISSKSQINGNDFMHANG